MTTTRPTLQNLLLADLEEWEREAEPILASERFAILGGRVYGDADDSGPTCRDFPCQPDLALAVCGCSAFGRSAHLIG